MIPWDLNRAFGNYHGKHCADAGGEELCFGADIRWTFKGFLLQMEDSYGVNAGSDDGYSVVVNQGLGHSLCGAHAIASYRLRLSDTVALLPAVMAEVFDPDDQAENDTVFHLAGALNADIGEHVRVILSIEGADKTVRYDTPTTVFLQLNLRF